MKNKAVSSEEGGASFLDRARSKLIRDVSIILNMGVNATLAGVVGSFFRVGLATPTLFCHVPTAVFPLLWTVFNLHLHSGSKALVQKQNELMTGRLVGSPLSSAASSMLSPRRLRGLLTPRDDSVFNVAFGKKSGTSGTKSNTSGTKTNTSSTKSTRSSWLGWRPNASHHQAKSAPAAVDAEAPLTEAVRLKINMVDDEEQVKQKDLDEGGNDQVTSTRSAASSGSWKRRFQWKATPVVPDGLAEQQHTTENPATPDLQPKTNAFEELGELSYFDGGCFVFGTLTYLSHCGGPCSAVCQLISAVSWWHKYL